MQDQENYWEEDYCEQNLEEGQIIEMEEQGADLEYEIDEKKGYYCALFCVEVFSLAKKEI